MTNYKPQNPLDGFQSHSIHYVMLACRSTQDIWSFTSNSQQAATESLQAIDATQRLGDEVQFRSATGTRGAGVYLMMDTRRFSQFTIQNFSLETYVSGFTVPGSNTPNATAVNMSFTVLDSMGISFANFLQYLMDQKLRVSYQGMTVLIRVLFVGHRADGTTSTIQSVTIPAIFDKIQVDLNDTKGVYECKLFPMIGMPSNAGYNAKWTSIGAASSYFTGKGVNTLGAVIASFEKNLNESLLKRYSELNAVTQADGTKKAVGRFGRPVQYMITIPKEWETFTFSGPTQGGAVETNFAQLVKDAAESKAKSASEAQKKAQANTPSAAKDSFVAVDPELTITEVLDVIFSQTVGVAELANFTKKQDKNGNLTYYKHMVTVTSDDASFTVHVDVAEYFVPNVLLQQKQGATNQSGALDALLYKTVDLPNGAKIKIPQNYLEYDYIFTGKNLDVLNLDLKIENLNIMLMQGVKLGAGELFVAADSGQKQEDGESVGEDKRVVNGMRAKDPALMPVRTQAEGENFSNLGANISSKDGMTPQAMNQQYMQNLSAFYNAGPVTAKMELRGNPRIMAEVALTALPQHVNAITITDTGGATSDINPQVKQKYREAFEKNLLKTVNPPAPADGVLTGTSYVASPVFVKVNVFGPKVDYMTNELISGGSYAQEVFFHNYYYLEKITSKIEGSKFTQELELKSFSVFGFPSVNTNGATTSTVSEK